jgi:hypothetical protein
LTYAEGRQLNEEQLARLKGEMEDRESREALFAEFRHGIESAMERVRGVAPGSYAEVRGVGRQMLLTSVGGLLVHCADHTQRHVGQLVTTSKVIEAMRDSIKSL